MHCNSKISRNKKTSKIPYSFRYKLWGLHVVSRIFEFTEIGWLATVETYYRLELLPAALYWLPLTGLSVYWMIASGNVKKKRQ